MSFVVLCELTENGRGGFQGVVDGEKRGSNGWMVPDGTKFVVWPLGDPRRMHAFLLDAIQPVDVGSELRERDRAHILCKMWKSQGKESYYGALRSGYSSTEALPGRRPWDWELPMGLGFTLFDDRGKGLGFKLKSGGVARR